MIEFIDSIPTWVNALLLIFAGAKAITIMTDTRSDDKIVDAILRVLNLLAGNFGKDKNKDSE